MVTIAFPDRETEKRTLGFLLGRFSGRVFTNGMHVVPEPALNALTERKISFRISAEFKPVFRCQDGCERSFCMRMEDRGWRIAKAVCAAAFAILHLPSSIFDFEKPSTVVDVPQTADLMIGPVLTVLERGHRIG